MNTPDVQVRTVATDQGSISYSLTRKPVKNINLRVHKDGSVHVSASPERSEELLDGFISKKAGFIFSAQKHFREIEATRPQSKQYVSGETFLIQGRALRLKVEQDSHNSISSDGVYITMTLRNTEDRNRKARIMNRWLDQQCKEVFSEIIDEIYPIFRKYGIQLPELRIRNMDTRWGSCLAKKGIITLNKQLLEVPRSCIEYVVLHEFCHFVHPNHSRRFYDFVAMLMPDWKERKAELEKYAGFVC